MSTTEDIPLDSTIVTAAEYIDPDWARILHLGRSINYYGTPFICVVGMLGNIATFLIMSRPSFNKSSSSIYFRALAVADFLVLFIHLIALWVEDHFDESWHWCRTGYVWCKVCFITFGWPSGASAMTLVALTFERFLVTAMPLKTKQYCTRRNAKIVCATINITLILAWFIPIMIVHKLNSCLESMHAERHYAMFYASWIYSFFYTYLPSPIILILNSFLVYKLIMARRSRLKMSMSQESASLDQYQRLTIMAVVVSLAFFLLTLPPVSLSAVANWADPTKISTLSVLLLFGQEISLLLRASNHALNFPLYLMSNQRIRTEFMSMMCAPFDKLGLHDSAKATKETMSGTTSLQTVSTPKASG